MAKTPKVTKREISIHSRAARRNASPPAQELVKASTNESEYKPWLHNAQNAGITKKKKVKRLTRHQRLRQQKGVEKADAIEDKLEKKVKDSKSRARKIKGRAVDWDDLNETLERKKRDVEKKMTTTSDEGHAEDVLVPDLEQPMVIRSADMTGVEEVGRTQPDVTAAAFETDAAPLPMPEDDEIL